MKIGTQFHNGVFLCTVLATLGEYTLLLLHKSSCVEFVVAWNLKDNLQWSQGHYFDNLEDAVKYLNTFKPYDGYLAVATDAWGGKHCFIAKTARKCLEKAQYNEFDIVSLQRIVLTDEHKEFLHNIDYCHKNDPNGDWEFTEYSLKMIEIMQEIIEHWKNNN